MGGGTVYSPTNEESGVRELKTYNVVPHFAATTTQFRGNINKEETDVEQDTFKKWAKQNGAPRPDIETYLTDILRKQYPSHSMMVLYPTVNVLNFPEALSMPMPDVPAVKQTAFRALPRRSAQPGVLRDNISFGAFKLAWKEYDFVVYAVSWREGPYSLGEQIVLHDGPQSHIQALAMAAGAYSVALHDEILVLDQGWWRPDHQLWLDVQKANWGDIIMKEEFKQEFRRDIDSFFESESLYKKYAIPWKRGIIMHGPPGNGKTISLKAVMKYSKQPCLYVRSFQTWQGEEYGMTLAFEKAREYAPCIMVLEDIDTLVTDRNRSFFLNQLDGLAGNDGLLLLSTTNHLDKLDPSLSQRPSRFDRKYLFDDPDLDERKLYCKYWQDKLKDNTAISFPNTLLDKIAIATERFSFAYLKEAFVSSLVLMTKGPSASTFEEVIMEQISLLKKGLGDSDSDVKSV